MNTIATAVERLDWPLIAAQLNEEGYAVLPGFLSEAQRLECLQLFNPGPDQRRSQLSAQLLGQGEVIHWQAGASGVFEALRAVFYPPLVRIANSWNETLGVLDRYPPQLARLHALCQAAEQRHDRSCLLRLVEQDYLGLQQHAQGEQVFPLQLIGLLSSPGDEFSGGECVLTEQRPRMQSRPMVVPLRAGDLAIICTAQRPFKGSKGYYRVNIKHAISRVRSGERLGFELTFHLSP